MTPWQRLKNFWHPKPVYISLPFAGITPSADLDELAESLKTGAVFIPRNKRDPVKELTQHE